MIVTTLLLLVTNTTRVNVIGGGRASIYITRALSVPIVMRMIMMIPLVVFGTMGVVIAIVIISGARSHSFAFRRRRRWNFLDDV